MSVERTRATMTAYLQTLLERGAYSAHFADTVSFTVMGTNQQVTGREAVEQFIRYLHEQAFDAQPEVRTTIIGDDHAALEADLVGTHTGEFAGMAATGKPVRVPYAVFYDLQDGKITALRGYLPMDSLLQQIGATPTTDQTQV